MENNRKSFILGVLAGILLCIAGGAAYFYLPSVLSQKPPAREISVDKAISWIQHEDIKEVNVKQETVELTDSSGDRFVVTINSEPSRELILRATQNSGVKLSVDGSSGQGSGRGWFFVIQFLPFIFLGLFTIATASLVVLAYKALFNKRVEK
jgi:ATP-dependent Zn protease